MLRVRLRVLLLISAHLPLHCAELSHIEEASSIDGRDEVKRVSCEKDCEDRTRKRSSPWGKCEVYYYVPTAKRGETFSFWNNSKAEQLEAYYKISSFLETHPHEDPPIFFPAHLPLVEKRNGSEVLVLTDVYVRAKGTCIPGGCDSGFYDCNPAWYQDRDRRLQTELEVLEDYIERMPRSHFGYRVPKAGEDVCLDETGLVVKDFPGIRTCFSMWIFDDRDSKPKHFAGRQNYNRINQRLHVNVTEIGFKPSVGDSLVSTESFSLPALFLNEMCHVTNESRKNRCTFWTTDRFYVSLCCCYTNRTECAYKAYKFPAEKKEGDRGVRACATGEYYLMKEFGGNHEPKNISGIGSSVKEFVQERTSSEVCKWTYTWNISNETAPEDVMRVELDAEKPEAITKWMRRCTSDAQRTCCKRTTTLCPLDPNPNNNVTAIKCVCKDDDLCNKRRSHMDKNLVEMFRKARPCEAFTVHEHLLWQRDAYKKPNTNSTEGYMCPIFYNFAYPERKNTFLQLVDENNFDFFDNTDKKLFQEDGCHLVEVAIGEKGDCSEKLFGEHDETVEGELMILLCSVEGNPLGEHRKSYPDAELKKTIETNLTAAKEAFPMCKNDSSSLDFESLSELVMDNSKLFDLYNSRQNGTNDNITTPHCFVEVSFVYQQQYNFTFGAVSIENKSLHDSCHESESSPSKCVPWPSAANDEHQHFACCCRRQWNKTQDMCRAVLLDQLKTLLGGSVVAKKPEQIMSELTKDPLTKCDEADKTKEGHTSTELTRPCERNEGCYTSVHARDVPATTHHQHYGGCVAEDAPDAKKRDDAANGEIEARFYRICRLPKHDGQCFAVLGTEDTDLPDGIKGPRMVCCCQGKVESAKKCGTTHKYGERIRDLV